MAMKQVNDNLIAGFLLVLLIQSPVLALDPQATGLLPESCTIFIIPRARNFLHGYK